MNGVSTGKYGRSGTDNLVYMFDIITTMSTSNRRRHSRNLFSTPYERKTNERFATVAELLKVVPDLAMESCTLFYKRRHAAKQSRSAISLKLSRQLPRSNETTMETRRPKSKPKSDRDIHQRPRSCCNKNKKKKPRSRNRHNMCTMAQLWHVTYDP